MDVLKKLFMVPEEASDITNGFHSATISQSESGFWYYSIQLAGADYILASAAFPTPYEAEQACLTRLTQLINKK
jgi:citrate lyase synthetase